MRKADKDGPVTREKDRLRFKRDSDGRFELEAVGWVAIVAGTITLVVLTLGAAWALR